MFNHITVLQKEAIEALKIKNNGTYVDMTLGGGGHTEAILNDVSAGQVYAFDQDEVAIENGQTLLAKYDNLTIIQSNFANLTAELAKYEILQVDGILFDLGVSSMQLDIPERGFSYRFDAPLDMRMDKTREKSAYQLVNTLSVEELSEIFAKYGEEKFAYPIAKQIVRTREEKEIETTMQLNELIVKAIGQKNFYNAKGHPSKRVFQALRIAVNDELEVFESALVQAKDLVKSGGRIVVISFHSLEDRITKHLFKKWSSVPEEVAGLPIIPEEYLPKYKIITRKPISATKEEIEENKRSKSAKMRVLEKL